jgi:hypothetical protein
MEYYIKVEWKYEKLIKLTIVPTSPYGPALGSKVQKNPASIADSGKNRKCDKAHGDNIAVYGKCDIVFLGK